MTTDDLEYLVDKLKARLFQVENEAIALATENSNLRHEIQRIKDRVTEINSLPWSTDTVDALADFVEDWE
jgi:regulator of replication initiation timing